MENIKTKKPRNMVKFKDNLWGWLFIALPVIGTTVFVFVPLIMTIWASFTNWSATTAIQNAKWVGFENYVTAFKDAHFWQTLGNTFFYMIGVPIGMILSLLLAMAMNRKIHFSSGFRVIYYIPVVASVVSISLLFSRMFDINGVINRIINAFGGKSINWTSGPGWLKKLTIVIMMTWKGLGGTILLFIAGLQGVNKTYYEAAKLDGANNFQIFTKITLPALYPVVFYVLVTSIIGGAQIYTEPALFYSSNASDYGVMPLVQYLYGRFTSRYAGYSAAIGILLGLIVFILTAIQFGFNRKKED